ncbi:hypothetical protein HA466_0057590 [Hirschfeldia incana]|nr:hypothetical protein HA466_0057590 [Hirschfeldia incana]
MEYGDRMERMQNLLTDHPKWKWLIPLFLRELAISSAIHKHAKIQPLRADHTVFVSCIATSKGIAISRRLPISLCP